MTTPNCLTCRHHSHDAEKIPVCEKVYGWLACLHCKRIQPLLSYSRAHAGLLCLTCNRGQSIPMQEDWREGYIGRGVNGHVTPLPCCPGWEAVAVVEPEKKKVLPGQKSLFGDEE